MITHDVIKSELLDARDVAKILNVSIRHVWRLRSAGLLPQPVRIGSAVRWTSASIKEFIEQGGAVNDR